MKKLFFSFAAMLLAVAMNAAVINIDNTTADALRLALGNAADGDEIVMAAGTYVESNGNYIAFDGKAVTVKAAEGANVIIQPQVPITVSNGGHAIFENVKIDASHLTDLADWYEHLLYVTDENPNGCTFRGCELYGFNLNKSMFYCNATNKVAAMKFEDCYFHDLMKSIIFVENTAGKPILSVKNCTFANIATNTESYWAGIIDVRAAEATLTVDHCTFYNVIPMNTDYSCVSKITLTKGNVSNCIFMLPTAQDGIRAMRGVTATNCITFNYLKDNGTGIHSSVTQNNCIQADPLFVDAPNGNFKLGEGSPALTLNDGQAIGDPRWNAAPAVEPLIKTIYCKMDKAWWTADGAAVGIYTWTEGGAKKADWPGERMTLVEGETDVWSIDIDINTYKMCIFTRVNGEGEIADWGAKTTDLTIPTDDNDLFTITNAEPTWGDPGCSGEWSKYEKSADPSPIVETYFATGDGWAPDAESKAEWDAAAKKVTVTIAMDKVAQWQAQVKYQAIASEPGKFYNFGLKMKANNAVSGITVKWDDNTGLVLKEGVALEANTEYAIDLKKVASNAAGNGIIVFDFGFAKTGDIIEIYDIVVEEAEAPTVDLQDGYYLIGLNGWDIYALTADDKFAANDGAEGEYMITKALAANNEFKVVAVAENMITTWYPGEAGNYVVDLAHAGEAKVVYFRPNYDGGEGWYAGCIYVAENEAPVNPIDHTYFATGAGWDADNESSAVWDPETGKITVTIALPKVAAWQGQIFINTVKAEVGKCYNFSVKMKSNKNLSGATIKWQENNDDPIMVSEINTISLVAGEEFVYSKEKIAGQEGNGQLVYDFGYAEAGTVIEIYDLVIVETACEDEGFDNTNAPVKAVKMIRNGQILINVNGKFYNAVGVEVK